MSENKYGIYLDGTKIGEASLGDLEIITEKSSEVGMSEDTIINTRCVGTIGLINPNVSKDIIKQFRPSYELQIKEVLDKIHTLKGNEREKYVDDLPKTLDEINDYAHQNEQIASNERIVIGLCEETHAIGVGIVYIPEDYNCEFPSIVAVNNHDLKTGNAIIAIKGAAQYIAENYRNKPNSKENRDALTEDLKGAILDTIDSITSYIPKPLNSSEKRGKKGKKLRNWDKKQFWQKGR